MFLTLVGTSLFIQEKVIMRKSHLNWQLFVIILLGISLQACGSIQQMIQGTPTFTPTITLTPSPIPTATPTLTPTLTPTATVTPNVLATQQHEAFLLLVQKYYDAGQISSMEGEYRKLDDFSDELAMGFGYRWTPTGVDAKDFIVRAEFEWSVANQRMYSGCGYVFREKSTDYYYLIALDALNGILLSYTKDGYDSFGKKGPVNYTLVAAKRTRLPNVGINPYHAVFTLIVNQPNIYTYVNDNFFTEHRLRKDWLTDPGPLSYMILTGSGSDYGTRCKISNVEAWVPVHN